MATWSAWRLAPAFGLAILITPGCGSSPTGPGPTPTPAATPAATTTFTGTIAGSSGESGTLVIRIAAAVSSSAQGRAQAAANATATLTLINGGGTFALSGTFDEVTRTLTLGGSGFSLTGTIANGQVTGNYTGPNGSVGIFSSLDSTRQNIQPYCGTYHRVTEDGVWNFEIAASGEVSGNGIATSGPSSIGASRFFITGTRTGSTVDLTVHTNDGNVAVTGTIRGSSVGGSYIDNEGLPGTFTGGTC
jgi:hypothetical protein